MCPPPEALGPRGHAEGSGHPGEEAPRGGPQWLGLPGAAPGGGAGTADPGPGEQGSQGVPLPTEQPDQRRVSSTLPGNSAIASKVYGLIAPIPMPEAHQRCAR